MIGKVVLPFIKRKRFKGKLPEATRLGWVSAALFSKKFLVTSAWTFLVVGLLFKLINIFARLTGNSNVIDSLLASAGNFNSWVENIRSERFVLSLIILGVVFLIILYRNGKKTAQNVYKDLMRKYEKGQLASMPPDKRMEEIAKSVGAVEEEANRVVNIPDGALSSADQKRKKEYIGTLQYTKKQLNQKYVFADLDRRVIPEIEKQAPSSEKTGRWSRMLNFLSSEGFVRVIGRSNKLMSRVGIILLLMSFLGASKGAIQSASSAQIRQLVDLNVQIERNEVEQWDETLVTQSGERISEEEWTDEDEEVLDAIAHDFELAFANSLVAAATPALNRASPSLFRARTHAVRTNILGRFQANANQQVSRFSRVGNAAMYESHADFHGTRPTSSASSSNYQFAESLEKEALQAGRSPKPQTSIGQRYKESLRGKISRYPSSVWQDIKAKYASEVASFNRMATPRQVFGMTVSETLDGLAYEAFRGGGDDLSNTLSNRLTRQMSTGTVKNWVEINMNNYTQDLVAKPDLSSARQTFANRSSTATKFVQYQVSASDVIPSADQLSSHLSQHPPFLERLDRTPDELKTMDRSLRNLATRNRVAASELAANANSFKSLFPGVQGAELQTVAGSMSNDIPFERGVVEAASQIGGGGGGGGSGSAAKRATPRSKPRVTRTRPPVRTASVNMASRARSFSSLRGFRRIGGVLIGQEPSNTGKTDADFTGVEWETTGKGVHIILRDRNGQSYDAGTYSSDIVHQALVYAADGRPVTATMIKLEIINALKILTHPALTDTQLGCEAIAIDRFVDEYASREKAVSEALRNTNGLNLLYRYSVFLALADDSRMSYTDKLELEDYITEFETALSEVFPDVYRYYSFGNRIEDEGYTFIHAHPELYHSGLWGAIKYALTSSNGSLSNYRRAMSNRRVQYDNMEDLLRADIAVWSGVRETPYRIDNQLSFLSPETTGLEPLRFMEQIAFIPLHDEKNYDPWEFPALENSKVIEKAVSQGMGSNYRKRLIYERIKSFTLAQRLFRAAFNGDLGQAFPVEKLSVLANETQQSVKWKPTPRFNGYIGPNDLELYLRMTSGSEDNARYLREFIKACGIMDEQNQDPCG